LDIGYCSLLNFLKCILVNNARNVIGKQCTECLIANKTATIIKNSILFNVSAYV